MERVHFDFLGHMLETKNGNSYVVMMVDQLTIWVEFILLPSQLQKLLLGTQWTIFSRDSNICSRSLLTKDDILKPVFFGNFKMAHINKTRTTPKDSRKRLLVQKAFVKELLSLFHDLPACGHQGILRTKLRVSEKYYWYKLCNNIKDYIRSCQACNKTGYKEQHRLPHNTVSWRCSYGMRAFRFSKSNGGN